MPIETFENWLEHVEVSGKRLTPWQLAWAREVLVNNRMPVSFRGRRTIPQEFVPVAGAFRQEYPNLPEEGFQEKAADQAERESSQLVRQVTRDGRTT